MKRVTDKNVCITGDRGGKTIYSRLWMIENILGEDYDLDRLRELMKIGRCKDCIHYFQSECLKIYDDGACSEYARQERKPDDFCSYFECVKE